jgi:hypothetical protein
MTLRFIAIALLLWSLADSAQTRSDDGSGLDPHGGRTGCVADTDEGNGIDPHG